MARLSGHIVRARISRAQFRAILRLFALDLTAVQISHISGLNRNTVNRYLMAVRKTIASYCEMQGPFSGEVELDESYFGPRRQKGKRGRGAYGKTIVFGVLKRNSNVYTQIIPNCSRSTLRGVIQGKVTLESVIHTDGWIGYDGLVDLGYRKHYRVSHQHDEFVDGAAHINGIESFWGFAKSRLQKLRGVNPSTFYLHLKECEFRFNHRRENLYKVLLKIAKF